MTWKRAGQRVRLARPALPCNIDSTGVIVSMIAVFVSGDYSFDCEIAWDEEVWLEGNSIPQKRTMAHTDQLEPIIDDGHKKVSWKELENLWTPEKLMETVSQ